MCWVFWGGGRCPLSDFRAPLVIPPGEGNGNPLQYSCLENSKDRIVWQATVYSAAKSWTQLSNQYTLLSFLNPSSKAEDNRECEEHAASQCARVLLDHFPSPLLLAQVDSINF